MKHRHVLKGPSAVIRPIELDDACFVAALRSDKKRTRYMHPVENNEGIQRDYLRKYFEKTDDFYFVIESADLPKEKLGLTRIEQTDRELRVVEWNSWVIRPGSRISFESALLSLQFAFNGLKSNAVEAVASKENKKVISFLESCSFKKITDLPEYLCLNGKTHDFARYRLPLKSWPETEKYLSSLAERISDHRKKIRCHEKFDRRL